ncbi:hypothetical protein L837_0982 [Mycobacterium avium MAV_061107_1842]|nr:hypothetical protein L837_0982 [Mycobacterium avium MAV_061107_1842]
MKYRIDSEYSHSAASYRVRRSVVATSCCADSPVRPARSANHARVVLKPVR